MNNYIKRKLKNGVNLYLYIDKNMKKTFVDYIIDYGSNGKFFDFNLDGKDYHVLPGTAHFLEHMLGEHSKYGNFYKIFGSRGYSRNGGTALDYTQYYFIGKNDIKDSIKILIESIDDPVFTVKDVEETRFAIAEETKRNLNSTGAIFYGMINRNLYKNIEVFHDSLCTIGNEKTTYDLTYETLKACYEAFYYDENKTLVIGGNFDEQEMVDYLESIYKNLKPHKKNVTLKEYKDLDEIRTKKEIRKMPTNDDIVGMYFKNKIDGFSKFEIAYYSDFMIENKFSKKMPFIEKLINDNIISGPDCDCAEFVVDGYYQFLIGAKVKDNMADKFMKLALDEIKINSFNKKDFDLYIRREMANQAFSLDNKYNRLLGFASRKMYSDDFSNIENLKKLNFERFIEFYKSINFDNYTIGIITNKKDTK